MLDVLIRGGALMFPILSVTIAAVLFPLLTVWVIRRQYNPSLAGVVVRALQSGDREGALEVCERQSSNAIAGLLGDAIRYHRQGITGKDLESLVAT